MFKIYLSKIFGKKCEITPSTDLPNFEKFVRIATNLLYNGQYFDYIEYFTKDMTLNLSVENWYCKHSTKVVCNPLRNAFEENFCPAYKRKISIELN